MRTCSKCQEDLEESKFSYHNKYGLRYWCKDCERVYRTRYNKTPVVYKDPKYVKKGNIYSRWSNIKARCYNPNHKDYKNYGGRGIIMCEQWKDYNTFVDWHIDNYIEGYEIDRVDNNGNYEPSNCRFVTKTENLNNKRPYTK